MDQPPGEVPLRASSLVVSTLDNEVSLSFFWEIPKTRENRTINEDGRQETRPAGGASWKLHINQKMAERRDISVSGGA